MGIPYRIGIDIGTNSLGWCVLDLGRDGQPKGIRKLGVRIFADGRNPSGTSLAVDRRNARSARRRRDRFLDRRADLMRALIKHGLMPTDLAERKKLEAVDPYELRANGLTELLMPYFLGRALFHINQRRGFKSNRKTDKAQKDSDLKGMKGGISKLREAMAGRTLGQYLYEEFRKGRSVRGSKDGIVKAHVTVRARPHVVKGKNEYDLYADRAMYEEEFDRLWQSQTNLGLKIGDAARDEIRDIIFYQRNLKPINPGKCALNPTEERAPLALPSVQRFRIWQELNNLRLIDLHQKSIELTLAQKQTLFEDMKRGKDMTFKRIRSHKKLNIGSEYTFNLESEKRTELDGDGTAKKLSDKKRFGDNWHALSLAQQDEVVEKLLNEEQEELLISWLRDRWGLSNEAASEVASVPLEDGYGRVGKTAIGRMMPYLEAGARYDEAADKAGYRHSDRRTGEILDALPYYGYLLDHHVGRASQNPDDIDEVRYGRIANPTVHIGLNQLRSVINHLIERYGKPAEIVVELARELKLGKKQKDELNKKQTENQKANDQRRAKLRDLGLPENGENMLRLRLWEELNPSEPFNRRCPYTGDQIGPEKLFSSAVEIEHILPFRRTLDNSPANKTVSMVRANRYKGNRSPFEAFGDSRDGFNWAEIERRAADMPKNKRWRFAVDAMDKFSSENDFLARQLADTQYLSRATREYLSALFTPDQGNPVWVIPGRLTEMLRGKWGLNQLLSDHNLKNRFDHRHHTIDAFVIGVTDRSLLKKVADAADQNRERLIDDMPDPWDGFREELKARIDKVVVSHRPDHGIGGRLHEETAYGLIKNPATDDGATLVYRKPLAALNENEIERIRDRKAGKAKDKSLRAKVKAAIEPFKGSKLAVTNALASFGEINFIRHVRLTKVEAGFIKINDRLGESYKVVSPGDIHRIEIFQLPNGNWEGEAITVFEANQDNGSVAANKRHPEAKFIMTILKGDCIALEDGGITKIMKVHRLDASASRFKLAGNTESGNLQKRHDDTDDPFRWAMISYNQLKQRKARKVTIDHLGVVNDPGPPT
ncbi:type II CRISPR RNA-guided endonuclease Cas9 [Ferrovibrio sp.]|uniref:type II CRISPR RNA-guided endonuclease Cas9 n=1 Tax=Ferrovibrio sp. TaxID=1917215 RepID=UPI0035B4B31B